MIKHIWHKFKNQRKISFELSTALGVTIRVDRLLENWFYDFSRFSHQVFRNVFVLLRDYTQSRNCYSGITANTVRLLVIPFSDIIPDTLTQEINYTKLVSFSVRGVHEANFNFKFKSRAQALHFITFKVTKYSVIHHAQKKRFYHLSPFWFLESTSTWDRPMGKNIFESTTGHHSIRIFGQWRFRI